MIKSLHYFNKLRRYLGIKDALRVYNALRLSHTGKIKLDSLKHSFRLRVGDAGDSAVFNEVMLRREYDITLGFIPETIIDGGAHIGLTSVFFANKYPGAQIIAIEPGKVNYELAVKNTAPYSNIQLFLAALWSSETTLGVIDRGLGSHAIAVTASNHGDIRAVTIRGIMEQQNWRWIDILKLDIEGAEKELFAHGAGDWLPKVRVLIIELHDRFVHGSSKAVFSALAPYNFSCRVAGFNLVFFNDDI